MFKFKTVIVDNHSIARAGWKLILEPVEDFQVIGDASNGDQAIEICRLLRPDLVLMDINMPYVNGIEATQVLHREFPQLLIIGISGFRHEEIQKEIIQAGAIGYISKETDYLEIIAQIRQLVQGIRSNEQIRISQTIDLTGSEHKILSLLAEGHNRQQIADHIGISINTVKMHIRSLYQKLNVSNANEAIKIALQLHLIS